MKKEVIAFYIILFIGAIIRLLHISVSPLKLEELELITYIENSGLSKLMEEGLKRDKQPALLKLFVFFWIKIFGSSFFSIRLPFAVFGILNIYYAYKCSTEIIGKLAALFVSATMALSVYFIIPGQYVQSYLLGSFLLFLFLYYFILFLKGNHKFKVSFTLVIAAALTMVSHYFASLTLTLILISGYFLKGYRYKKKYLTLIFFIILLCLPHAFISLHHLSLFFEKTWPQWYAFPDTWDYLMYVHNNHLLFLSMSFLILIFSLIINRQRSKPIWILIALGIFLINFIFYGFSQHNTSVNSYSSLIFSTPLLLMGIFCFSTFNLRKLQAYTFLSLYVFIGLFTYLCHDGTFNENKKIHYQILSEKIRNYQDSLESENIQLLYHTEHPEYYSYFLEKSKAQLIPRTRKLETYQNISELQEELNEISTKHLLLLYDDSLKHEAIEIIRQKYSIKNISQTSQTSALLFFEKTSAKLKKHFYFYLEHSLESNIPQWEVAMQERDSNVYYSASHSLKIKSYMEYAMTYRSKLAELFSGKNAFLTCQLAVKMQEKSDCRLVISIQRGEKMIHWKSYHLQDYYQEGKWFLPIYVYELPLDTKSDDLLLVYLWNPNKSTLWVDNFQLSTFNYNNYKPILLK